MSQQEGTDAKRLLCMQTVESSQLLPVQRAQGKTESTNTNLVGLFDVEEAWLDNLSGVHLAGCLLTPLQVSLSCTCVGRVTHK